MIFITDVPLSLTGCSGRDRQSEVVKWRKDHDIISSMTFIIDVPLSLTTCSGRDRQSVVVKWRER